MFKPFEYDSNKIVVLLYFSTLQLLQQSKLPPEVNRILYVRNLPFTMTTEELYGIFGKYGAVYQIRLGDKSKDSQLQELC